MEIFRSTPLKHNPKKIEGYTLFIGFILTIPAANWLIGNVGTTCLDKGPCLIPVGPNLMAPSGVLMIGLALVLRDLVQRRLGAKFSLIAIIIGALISALFATPSLIIASGLSFLISELADFIVYTPLQRRRLVLAVFASSLIGLIIDSVLFLYLAFGNLDYLAGQVFGKGLMVLVALPAIVWIRQRDEKLGITQA